MNKKGQILLWLIVLAVLVGIFFNLRYLEQSVQKGTATFIGDEQLSLLAQYQKSDNELFYLDQSAKFAAYATLQELGKKGGFAESSPCGLVRGYPLWTVDEECTPDARSAFTAIYARKLQAFLKETPFKDITHDLIVYENELIGIADKPLQHDIIFREKKLGTYSTSASFRVKLPLSMAIYEDLGRFMTNTFACTKNKLTQDAPLACINAAIAAFNARNSDVIMTAYYWNAGFTSFDTGLYPLGNIDALPADKFIFFKVVPINPVPAYQNGIFSIEAPILFALFFN